MTALLKKTVFFLSFVSICFVFSVTAENKTGYIVRDNYLDHEDVKMFIVKHALRHNVDGETLKKIFAQIKPQSRVLELITSPMEAKPWHQYHQIFLTSERVSAGVRFWNDDAELLSQAANRYGVPEQVLVAVIGVETFYGQQTGGFRVIDTLATLGFDYPPRQHFFKSELHQFLLLTNEEAIDPLSVKGSYAGAMGKPQFISSSYREYAVDFDEDGKRDLWKSNADAIGSVANYFKRHGWLADGKIVVPAKVSRKKHKQVLTSSAKPSFQAKDLKKYGIRIDKDVDPDILVALIKLQSTSGPEYWVGFKNFYVITRYNRSNLYAMAVYQLSQEILKERNRRMASTDSQHVYQ